MPIIKFIFKKINFKITYFFLLMINLILILYISAKFFKIVDINYPVLIELIAIGAGASIIINFIIERKVLALLSILLIGAVSAYFVYHFEKFHLEKYIEMYNEIYTKFNMLFYYSKDIEFDYIIPILNLLIPALIVTYIMFYIKGFGLIASFIQFSYISYVTYVESIKLRYSIAFVFLLAFFISISLYDYYEKSSEKKRIIFSVNKKSTLLYSMFLMLLLIGTSSIMIKATGTRNLKEIRQQISTDFSKIISDNFDNSYDISSSGFGNKSDIGGPAKLSDDIVFRIEGNSPKYLRGIVKDNYDGHTWSRTGYAYSIASSPNSIFLEKEIQDVLFGKHENDEFKEPQQIKIFNESYSNSTIFTPYNTLMVVSPRRDIVVNYDDTYMISDKKYNFDFYNVSYYKSTSGIEDYGSYFANGNKLDYNPFSSDTKDKETYDDVKLKYKEYLQLPEVLTERTLKLIDEASGKDTLPEYKIYNIMNYLKNTYPYSLDVSDPPSDKEFLDYFLFEERKGYCTYFATAAVVFARKLGIPARYVEGYSIKDLKDESGLYLVKSNMAHAWCEILVSQKYNIWAALECTPSNSIGGTKVVEKSNKSIEKLRKSTEGIDISLIQSKGKIVLQKNNAVTKIISFTKNTVITLGLLILIVIISYFCYCIIEYLKSKKRILNHDRINLFYYKMKERLNSVGIIKDESLSEKEYVESISDEKLKEFMLNIIRIYEKEYYAEVNFDKSYNKKEFYKYIEKYIRKKQNIFKYYMIKLNVTAKWRELIKAIKNNKFIKEYNKY